jgi:hypothetical protein
MATLDASQRLFARLLHMYPRRFRQEYGEQVAQVFRDCSKESLAETGIYGLLHLWLVTLPDLFKTSAQEHLKEIRMAKFISDPKTRVQAALILCLPLVVGSLLDATGAGERSSILGGSAIVSGVVLVMMLVGLWLFGAPVGLSALMGMLSILPLAVMQLVNRREYGEDFPFALFSGLGLMAAIFTATLIPMIKDLRAGKSFRTNLLPLVVRGIILIGVAFGWFSLVADQMPCFLGVKYCD